MNIHLTEGQTLFLQAFFVIGVFVTVVICVALYRESKRKA